MARNSKIFHQSVRDLGSGKSARFVSVFGLTVRYIRARSARTLVCRNLSLSAFKHYVNARHCLVFQLRRGAFVRSLRVPVFESRKRHGWRLGPVFVAFGVLDAGQGWSCRYHGFRLLWRGSEFARVRMSPRQES